MLVVSRKEFETIHVGDRITITVRKIDTNRVSIGIDAPREMNVRRGSWNPNRRNRSD